MNLQIKIPDSLYNSYQSTHHTKSEEEVKNLLKDRLLEWMEQLVTVDPKDRFFIVGGADRREVEKVFQTTVHDAKDLVKKLKALSSVAIGNIVFPLSAGESLRLTTQASFHGWTPEAFVENTCRELMDRFMEKI